MRSESMFIYSMHLKQGQLTCDQLLASLIGISITANTTLLNPNTRGTFQQIWIDIEFIPHYDSCINNNMENSIWLIQTLVIWNSCNSRLLNMVPAQPICGSTPPLSLCWLSSFYRKGQLEIVHFHCNVHLVNISCVSQSVKWSTYEVLEHIKIWFTITKFFPERIQIIETI